MPDCDLCCETVEHTTSCPFGHHICSACRGNTCPFCHPLDYVSLRAHESPQQSPAVARRPARSTDPELADPELADPELADPAPELAAPAAEVHLCQPRCLAASICCMALGAAWVKLLAWVVYADAAVPRWATWDDPELSNWLVEGSVGWLSMHLVARHFCRSAFSVVHVFLCAEDDDHNDDDGAEAFAA